MSQEEDAAPTEAEVLSHMAVVAHRVAVRIAETLPEGPERDAAVAAAEEVLRDDEGARELLAAAFEEGGADVRRTVLLRGDAPGAPDWSDVESQGERRSIAREEAICLGCSHTHVCAVAAAARSIPDALVVVRRCGYFEPGR